MKLFLNFGLLFLLTFLIACKHNETLEQADTAPKVSDESESVQQVTLKVGESVSFVGNTITFMQVSGDSRCPKGLNCVQAGKAQVVLLVAAGDAVETVTLSTSTNKNYNGLGYRLEVLKVSPYPKEGYFINKEDYHLEIKLSKISLKDYKILDVRSEKEFSEGYYPGATNIIHDQITAKIADLNLAKDAPIILYCRSGRRAGWALQALQQDGYTNVVNGINQTTLHAKFGTASKF